jgi:RNA polymerase sigma factor (sigma-70 family)
MTSDQDAWGHGTVRSSDDGPELERHDDAADRESLEMGEVLGRLAAGDLAARDRVIELCSGRLRLLARRMLARFPTVRRWDDTDDVFQNAAMRLHRALGSVTVESPRNVMALAATQLHRELIDLARRHAGPMSFAANHATHLPGSAGEGTTNPSGPLAAAAADPEESLDRWTLFHEAIASLPPELREVFDLVWYLGTDQKTIAGLLECSERTVKSRWRAARNAVRVALGGESPG